MTASIRRTASTRRTAIVTGASRGLGLALTEALAGEGWRVVVDARDGGALRAAIDPIADRPGADVVVIPGDVGDGAHRAELIAAATGDGSGIDLLVNNAGGLGPSPLPPLDAFPLEELVALFAVNVAAPLGLVQTALAGLSAAEGTIVNITSDAGVEPYEGWGGYGATKAALDHVGRVLAVEHPELRVLTVDPGDMRTQMHQDAFPGEDIGDRPPPEDSVPGLLHLICSGVPSGRYRVADVEVPTGHELRS